MSSPNQDELIAALNKLDIETWMDYQGVEYRRTRGSRGEQLNVRECPCCGSSKYKVYINAETGLGNCFDGDCQKTFNKWSFIKASLPSASVREVIDHIKEMARSQGWRPKKKVEIAVNMDTTLLLPDSIELPHNGRNLKYLENRGIDAATAKYFNLRFSQRGVFKYVHEGKTIIQNYANRIIIPIFDLAGDLVSFQGRDTTGEAAKKYLFPPGFASTGSILYNGQNALRAKHVTVGEGVFDVAAIKIAFQTDANLQEVTPIGSFGKHLSSGGNDSQLAKLTQLQEGGLESVTFMWDGEQKAILDALDAALETKRLGLTVRVAILPKDKDPNEVTPAVVREAFYKAIAVDKLTSVKLKLAYA